MIERRWDMKYVKLFLVLLIMTALGACQTTGGPGFSQLMQDPNRPKIALVLGGGAARGFAHVGVIRALEQEKIPIELEWTAFTLEKEHLFDYALVSAVMGMGPVKGDKLEGFIKSKIPVANIENLKLPYVAVATDLNRGTRVVLDSGPIARAVRASSAIPGVFQPVEHQGKNLVDGGVVDNIPID